jgi:uncharacterized membrane protein YdbT with pleckstrin-like domain
MDMDAEKTICEVSPSQILNGASFFFSLLAAAAIITAAKLSGVSYLYFLLLLPIIYAWWKWLQIRSIRLRLTDQRLILSEGVLNKTTNETELYRVRDSVIEEPFFYRMFGLGHVILYTTDEADARLRLLAFKKPHWIKDQIRNYSEICRQQKRWGNDNVMIHEHN